MRFAPTIAAIIVAAAACGGDGAVTNPDDDEAIAGISLSAAIVEINVTEATMGTIKTVGVEVVVRNTTNESIVHNYPAGCPVRMRLYSLTGALVYDQTALPCNVTSVASFTLGPQESRTFTSGTRFPWEVGGDSLPTATVYRGTAVLRITGEDPIELEAGTYRLPTCVVVGIATVCS